MASLKRGDVVPNEQVPGLAQDQHDDHLLDAHPDQVLDTSPPQIVEAYSGSPASFSKPARVQVIDHELAVLLI